MIDDVEVAEYEWLVEGFRRSAERFAHVAYPQATPMEAYIPLFEALNWAASIADRLGVGNKPDLLRAVEYARNAVHHEWVQALSLVPCEPGERLFGEGKFGDGKIWRWKATDDLPVQKADADRRPLYEHLLAGVSVISSLGDLAEYLPIHCE